MVDKSVDQLKDKGGKVRLLFGGGYNRVNNEADGEPRFTAFLDW